MKASMTAGGPLVGPWRSAFWFEVPFEVQSKSNFRRSKKGTSSRWGSLSRFEDSLVQVCRPHLPSDWDLGDKDSPVPKRPGVVAFIYARTLLDAANLSKSVPDALEGVVYHNDASIRMISSLGERTSKDQRGAVAFALLDPGVSTMSVIAAHSQLVAAAAAAIDESCGL